MFPNEIHFLGLAFQRVNPTLVTPQPHPFPPHGLIWTSVWALASASYIDTQVTSTALNNIIRIIGGQPPLHKVAAQAV